MSAGELCGPAHLLMAFAESLGKVAGAPQPLAMRIKRSVDCELCRKETYRCVKAQVCLDAA